MAYDASALGLAPSRQIIDYDTTPHTFTLRVVNNEHKDMSVKIYAKGDFASYVKIPVDHLTISKTESEKSFTYSVTLPANLEPGMKTIEIAVEETPLDTSEADQGTTIFSSSIVIHQLQVQVPYPGKYAEGMLFISNGNVNDTVTFTANVVNRGSEVLHDISGEIVIKGPTNEELYRVKSNALVSLDPQTSGKLVVNWLAQVNPGTYYAEFVVNYEDKQFVLRKTFVVGDYEMEIKDVRVGSFKLGAIAKFDVDIINRWNTPFNEVYGELHVLDQSGNEVSTFKTTSIEAKPLVTSTLQGYWDTANTKIGNYDIRVVLHYADKVSEKVFKTVVGVDSITVQDVSLIGNVVAKNESGKEINIWIILVGILVAINIGWFIYFKFLRKNDNTKPPGGA
jgi:hypothetical protein